MPMENSTPLKKLLMQVNKPVFAVQNDDGLNFVTKNNDLHRIKAFVPPVRLENLGDEKFKKRHALKYPYIAGAMANGITSADMVKTMSENGMIGFLGAGGLCLEKIEENIIELKNSLKDKPFGFNLIHSLGDPAHEMATVDLYLKHKQYRYSL